MSTILFTWELGGGLGHLMRIAPLAKGLVARGHRVFLASREVAGLERLFAGSGVFYLPAPYQSRPTAAAAGGGAGGVTLTFAHILRNCGFGDDRSLVGLTATWRNLYGLVRPNLVVCDHSPTALLACRGLPVRTAVIGTGFCVPPDVYPLPNLRPDVPIPPQRLRFDEDQLVGRINRLLRIWRHRPIERLGQLYSQADAALLTTFPELDHYADRPGPTRYWGPINGIGAGGKAVAWPEGPGKKVYAYLKNSAGLGALLACLRDLAAPTVVFGDGVPASMQRRMASNTLRFESERLDVSQAAETCDLAITNATFGTTAMMLMAGKPVLALPLYLEQAILGRRVEELGAGLSVPSRRGEMICNRLKLMIGTDAYASAAARLKERWSQFDPALQLEQMLSCLEQLAAPPAAAPAAPPRAAATMASADAPLSSAM